MVWALYLHRSRIPPHAHETAFTAESELAGFIAKFTPEMRLESSRRARRCGSASRDAFSWSTTTTTSSSSASGRRRHVGRHLLAGGVRARPEPVLPARQPHDLIRPGSSEAMEKSCAASRWTRRRCSPPPRSTRSSPLLSRSPRRPWQRRPALSSSSSPSPRSTRSAFTGNGRAGRIGARTQRRFGLLVPNCCVEQAPARPRAACGCANRRNGRPRSSRFGGQLHTRSSPSTRGSTISKAEVAQRQHVPAASTRAGGLRSSGRCWKARVERAPMRLARCASPGSSVNSKPSIGSPVCASLAR